ncbi:MAG TPA: anthranilate phosphoribosyltransferase [Pedococcus sp.]
MTDPARSGHTWPDLLTTLLGGQDLSGGQARWAMQEVMSGEATPVQLAGFLVALRAKGESVEEMRALADVMLAHANRIDVPGPSLDIVGTGGDRAHTVNISTMAAIVIAASGVRVVKHGNRAASSSSGSADVLEALGVNLALEPARVAEVAHEAGITFCFAQAFHPAFRHTAQARVGLAVPTAFNALGPLTNPAQPTYAAVGVADARLAPLLAGVFAGRGKDAAVLRGDDGLDELTLSTTSTVWWVRDGSVTQHSLDPTALGLARSPIEALRGGDARTNADVARRLFAGEHGPVRDAVVLNAGIALAVAADADRDGTRGLHIAVRAGMDRAAQALDTGAAARQLDAWVAATSAG